MAGESGSPACSTVRLSTTSHIEKNAGPSSSSRWRTPEAKVKTSTGERLPSSREQEAADYNPS